MGDEVRGGTPQKSALPFLINGPVDSRERSFSASHTLMRRLEARVDQSQQFQQQRSNLLLQQANPAQKPQPQMLVQHQYPPQQQPSSQSATRSQEFCQQCRAWIGDVMQFCQFCGFRTGVEQMELQKCSSCLNPFTKRNATFCGFCGCKNLPNMKRRISAHGSQITLFSAFPSEYFHERVFNAIQLLFSAPSPEQLTQAKQKIDSDVAQFAPSEQELIASSYSCARQVFLKGAIENVFCAKCHDSLGSNLDCDLCNVVFLCVHSADFGTIYSTKSSSTMLFLEEKMDSVASSPQEFQTIPALIKTHHLNGDLSHVDFCKLRIKYMKLLAHAQSISSPPSCQYCNTPLPSSRSSDAISSCRACLKVLCSSCCRPVSDPLFPSSLLLLCPGCNSNSSSSSSSSSLFNMGSSSNLSKLPQQNIIAPLDHPQLSTQPSESTTDRAKDSMRVPLSQFKQRSLEAEVCLSCQAFLPKGASFCGDCGNAIVPLPSSPSMVHKSYSRIPTTAPSTISSTSSNQFNPAHFSPRQPSLPSTSIPSSSLHSSQSQMPVQYAHYLCPRCNEALDMTSSFCGGCGAPNTYRAGTLQGPLPSSTTSNSTLTSQYRDAYTNDYALPFASAHHDLVSHHSSNSSQPNAPMYLLQASEPDFSSSTSTTRRTGSFSRNLPGNQSWTQPVPIPSTTNPSRSLSHPNSDGSMGTTPPSLNSNPNSNPTLPLPLGTTPPNLSSPYPPPVSSSFPHHQPQQPQQPQQSRNHHHPAIPEACPRCKATLIPNATLCHHCHHQL